MRSRKALGSLKIQHSAQIWFLHSPPAHTSFFCCCCCCFFAVNTQENPTLTYSGSTLIPTTPSYPSSPNHMAKASLINRSLLGAAIQDKP